jgi:tetratricopeptide (TPR) repeat protein
MQRGFASSRAGDRAGAVAAFREAVQAEPDRPEGTCVLAEANRMAGDFPAALEGYRACASIARTRGDVLWTSRGLAGVAWTLERMPGRLEDARTAWQEYVRFADGAAHVAHPEIGRARITAIDQVVELERVTAEVRQRIAEREAQHPPEPAAHGHGHGHGHASHPTPH